MYGYYIKHYNSMYTHWFYLYHKEILKSKVHWCKHCNYGNEVEQQ